MKIDEIPLEEIIQRESIDETINAICREITVDQITSRFGGRGSDFFLFPVLRGALKYVNGYEKLFRDRGIPFYRFDLEQEDVPQPERIRRIKSNPKEVKIKKEVALILDDDTHLGHSSLGAVVWALENRDALGIKNLYLLVECDSLGLAYFSPRPTYKQAIGIKAKLKELEPATYERLDREGAFSILADIQPQPFTVPLSWQYGLRPSIMELVPLVSQNKELSEKFLYTVNKLSQYLYTETILKREEFLFLQLYGQELVNLVNDALHNKLEPKIAARNDGNNRHALRYFGRFLEHWCMQNGVDVEYNELYRVWASKYVRGEKPYDISGGIRRKNKIFYVCINCDLEEFALLNKAVREGKIPNEPYYATLFPPQLVKLPLL